MLERVAGMRVLLTEGSSLTAREVVTCLGPVGHHLEVLDPDRFCLARFSRWVRRVHRCPPGNTDPLGYVQALGSVVDARSIEVVLPTHEQAWLLAVTRPLLSPQVRVAVATAPAFERVQSKVAFVRLLDELALPQPDWWLVHDVRDLAGLSYPYWLKTAFSTAGRGVREVVDDLSRDAALNALRGDSPLLAQAPAPGQYGQVQGLFDHGRLVAVHTSVQRGVGMGGSAAARLSVDHPAPREHIRVLGEALRWHGGLTLDYLHRDGSPQYIECNPRTVEPGNAAASGVNLPDLQARLTAGEELPTLTVGRSGVPTHGAIALLLGAAGRGGSRTLLLGEVSDAVRGRELHASSQEQLTPVRRDPPSLAAAAFVTARLLVSPGQAADIADRAVTRYSIGPATVAEAARAAGAPAPRP
ncbi:MAG: carbamoyl-phosphate-synthetase [bacterium]|jgi:hypothetical protein|nr:carbamoyl-phosphate-synthetase [bacterium]